MSKERVLVTGATGFVAMHTILQLREAGWQVRGTVRDLGKADRLRAVLGGDVELVEAHLDRDEGWAEAVAGCRYVLHVASPLPAAPPEHPDELIVPAREGALRVLRAAADVERVVMTSSTAAVFYGLARDGSKTYDERDWSDVERTPGAYERSKTIAERAAWDYARSVGLDLVTMLPGAILGPVLDPDFSVSGEIVKKLLTRELPAIPDVGWALVDVRDVADAHVRAMTEPRAAGQRFIVAGEHTPMREIARILAAHTGPLGFRVPTRRLPSLLLRLVARWDKAVRLIVPELGLRQDCSDAKARDLLGWQPRSVERMVIDMADSMIALDVVTPTRRRRRQALTNATSGARAPG